MGATQNKKLVEQFLWAMLKSDRPTMVSCLTLDTCWHPPAFVASEFGDVTGRDAVISFLCDNPERFYEPDSRTMELHALIAEGDLVSARFDFKARPLRGGELNTPANWMFRCVGGLIAETWEVLDTAEWSKAVLGPPAV